MQYKEDVMKANIIKLVVALLTSSAVSVYAASAGVGGEEAGLLIWALIGFAVLVVMLQAVPAMIMLVAMVKAVFAPAENTVAAPKA
jgi:hypothetical protein